MSDLGKTFREYLKDLPDTELSLEEIKVALLMGIWKSVCPQPYEVTKEDIERLRNLKALPLTITGEEPTGIHFCCPYCYKTSTYEVVTGNVYKENKDGE